MNTKNRWLIKTEPSAYSFEQLRKERRTVWDGVKNPLALRHMAGMRRGDPVVVYHTGSEKAAVGTARVVKDPYPDPKRDDPKLLVVELEAGASLTRPVTLAELKATAAFRESDLVRLPRLSVMPLNIAQWEAIETAARLPRSTAG
jgi:predicted RNA-binding protein with PUA-like domain